MADIARIEERLDRVAAGNTAVSDQLGGIVFQNMTEVMEFAKLMSLSGNAVPKHMQGNPGMCLAVCVQALEWRFSPFAVANKSYEVQGRLCFESQLVHALIEQRAPIRGRLQHRFEGEGDDRKCVVTAILRETGETMEYTSPAISKITPKNSPLWKTKPDLQLYYNTSRDFCRAYFPDVLLGVYAQDELREHVGPDNAKDVTKPDVASRLRGKTGRGFSAQHVERETRGGVIDSGATDAQHQPDRAATMAEPTDGGSDAPMEGESPSTISNSSQAASPAPKAETDKPASVSPADAGNHSETEVQRETAGEPLPLAQSGDEPRASEQESVTTGSGEAHDRVSESASPTLPDGWGIKYAGALRRAQKKESLSKYATQFWAQYGSWADHKNGPNAQTAIAIYDAFDKNFGNKDAIEEILREIV